MHSFSEPDFRALAPRRIAVLLAGCALGVLLSGCALTPTPLSEAEIAVKTAEAFKAATEAQEPVAGPIDLGEAMARAVFYNLDHRVEQLETSLRNRQIASAAVSALPQIALNAGYTGRNEPDASFSRSLRTGLVDQGFNVSTDQDLRTRDLSISWNVLDFGLSYVQAQQAADRTLIAEETRRRVMARIVEEVRSAYWRALAAEYLGRELRALEKEARQALANAQALVDSGRTPPLTALTYQREVYDLTDRLQTVEADVAAARNQLAALMNLPPGTRFTLVRPNAGRALPAVKGRPEDQVKEAITQRPEVREALYDQRIADWDGTKILLELLPGINLNAGPNYTSNSFTWANDWAGWGAQVTWNAMRLISYPVRSAEVEANKEVRAERLKATIASVALQVHVSRVRYEHALRRAETLGNYAAVQTKLLEKFAASAGDAQLTSENELIREKLGALLARARHDVAVADAQSAYAAILTTLGRDPYPQLGGASLKEAAQAFRKNGLRAPDGRAS
ncbi:TolC family protein [Alsobacter sp. R-9]